MATQTIKNHPAIVITSKPTAFIHEKQFIDESKFDSIVKWKNVNDKIETRVTKGNCKVRRVDDSTILITDAIG